MAERLIYAQFSPCPLGLVVSSNSGMNMAAGKQTPGRCKKAGSLSLMNITEKSQGT